MVTDPLVQIEHAIVDASHDIRAELTNRLGTTGRNPSGERQLAADIIADHILEESFCNIDSIGTYASEEREEPTSIGDGYSIAVDPLDGSSNLASNNPVGTIVSVYDAELPASGRDLVAAYFVQYGPLTTLVGVRDGVVTEQILSDGASISSEQLMLPDSPAIFGFGGQITDWPDPFVEFAHEIAAEFTLRYVGTMVADVNQVLTHGGIFSYPALEHAPTGKLRLQFEAIPMAAIIEAAGGASSNGDASLLHAPVHDLHQRTPVHLGNVALVDRLEAALA